MEVKHEEVVGQDDIEMFWTRKRFSNARQRDVSRKKLDEKWASDAYSEGVDWKAGGGKEERKGMAEKENRCSAYRLVHGRA